MVVRRASLEDVEDLVSVDLRAFRHVYRHYPVSPAELRSQLKRQFHWRVSVVPEWCVVAEHEGNIVGTMMSVPTRSTPETFVSWEEETSHGELEIIDTDAPNMYGVSMAVLPSAPEGTQDRLFLYSLGQMIAERRAMAFFEARMPGLRRWMLGRCRAEKRQMASLSADERTQLANEYFNDRVVLDNQPVHRDPELRIYEAMGVQLTRVVEAAYEDASSLDYGVVATVDNPLPERLRRTRASKLVGAALQRAAQSPSGTARVLRLLG